MKINTENLQRIAQIADASGVGVHVKIPEYDRSKVKQGIVHIGVGGFHRAHLALYMEKLLNQGKAQDWGICGVGLRTPDKQIQQALSQQDYLYSLFELQEGADKVQLIGAIGDFILADQEPARLIAKLTDADTRIVSLTITEGGYCIDDNTGLFNPLLPEIVADIANPDTPKTAFGYLALALKKRRAAGIKPFTVMSCDNLPNNGKVTRQVLLSFTRLLDVELSQWIGDNVSFPCAMVDRITPSTSPEHREKLQRITGIEDQWPVVCEPFTQWVLEDDFCNSRPPWEDVGVQFTSEVAAFEEMKIGLLNGSHISMALPGILMGLEFAHQAMEHKGLQAFIRAFMDKDVTPKLAVIENVDFGQYQDTLIARFANPVICDQLQRIASDASSKFPKFITPTLSYLIQENKPLKRIAMVVAAWIVYMRGVDEGGKTYAIVDPREEYLQVSLAKAGNIVENFLSMDDIFGDLVANSHFSVEVQEQLQNIENLGVEKALALLAE